MCRFNLLCSYPASGVAGIIMHCSWHDHDDHGILALNLGTVVCELCQCCRCSKRVHLLLCVSYSAAGCAQLCSRCDVNQSAADFYCDKKSIDGLSCWWKACYSEYSRRKFANKRRILTQPEAAQAASCAVPIQSAVELGIDGTQPEVRPSLLGAQAEAFSAVGLFCTHLNGMTQ